MGKDKKGNKPNKHMHNKRKKMNVLLGKSSLFRKCPDGFAFQHSGKFSTLF